ncbi:metallophosphoesterase, partial [Zooshikella sp. RANM57]|uniref:metallophosphoesterase n=1 Tax=Zooshikella sp. RANM57 TaxID=3425863 RepID=UPI003D6E8085
MKLNYRLKMKALLLTLLTLTLSACTYEQSTPTKKEIPPTTYSECGGAGSNWGCPHFDFCYEPSIPPTSSGSMLAKWYMDECDSVDCDSHSGMRKISYEPQEGRQCDPDAYAQVHVHTESHLEGDVNGVSYKIRINTQGATNNWEIEQGCGKFKLVRDSTSHGDWVSDCYIKNYDDPHPMHITLVEPQPESVKFTFAVIADTQAWRLCNLDNESPNCGDPNSESQNGSEWKGRMDHLVDQLNSETSVLFGLLNGDVTEFGRNGTFNAVMNRLANLNFPVYWGLGNHDYENNVGDCTEVGSINGCAYHMCQRMHDAVQGYKDTLQNVQFDWPINGDYSGEGSLAYSWDFKGVHFVQLQNHPLYENKVYHYDIKNSLDWLKSDLSGKSNIILLMHQHWMSNIDSSDPLRSELKAILDQHKPIAIFDGHTHHFDYSNLINDPTWGTVPVFTTEAAFYGGYHIV